MLTYKGYSIRATEFGYSVYQGGHCVAAGGVFGFGNAGNVSLEHASHSRRQRLKTLPAVSGSGLASQTPSIHEDRRPGWATGRVFSTTISAE